MLNILDSKVDDQLEVLHNAFDYVPKRTLRYFLENEPSRIEALITEMEEVLQNPDLFLEEGDSQILYFGLLLLASLQKREEARKFLTQVACLTEEQIEGFFGDALFDSMTVVIAEAFRDEPGALKALIEDPNNQQIFRASALQGIMVLYGQRRLRRDDLVQFFKKFLDQQSEEMGYMYDVIAAASMPLHPEELIDALRVVYQKELLETGEISLAEIEEVLALPKDAVIAQSQEAFDADLSDPIAHLEAAFSSKEKVERNDPCPCGSGLKYKKCCI